MKLALFDFDGTITKEDSLATFVKFTEGKLYYYLGTLLLSPFIIAYKLKIIPNHRAKEIFFSYFYKNKKADLIAKKGEEFARYCIPIIVKPSAQKRMDWHKRNGHKVTIVSASFDIWLAPWATENGYEFICTIPEIKQGRFTGKFHSKNCHGEEKVKRIRDKYKLEDFSYIYAYGDTKGDIPMLRVANESHYRLFS